MALDLDRMLDDAITRIEAAGKYIDQKGDPLEGEALEQAKAATREGLEFLFGPIIDEFVANAEISTNVSTNVSTTGSAATDGLLVVAGEVQGNASTASTGTGTGTGTGGIT